MTVVSLIIVRKKWFFFENRKFWIWIRSDWLLTNDVCCKQISLHLLESNKQSFKTFILIGSCDLKNFSKFSPIHSDLIHPRFLSRLSPDIVNGPWLCHFRTPGHFYRTFYHINFLRQPVFGNFFYQNLKICIASVVKLGISVGFGYLIF